MKKTVIVLMVLLIFPVVKSTAQNSNLEKLNAFKIGFFTKRLDLTSAEAEKFWPVYNEYQDQRNKLQLEKALIIRNFNRNESSLNDSQLTEMGDKLIDLITQESSLEVEFHKRLKEIFPPAKVIRFYQVENQYKAQLLNELQGVRQQQRNGLRRDF
jgi:hypothetical protein